MVWLVASCHGINVIIRSNLCSYEQVSESLQPHSNLCETVMLKCQTDKSSEFVYDPCSVVIFLLETRFIAGLQ